MLWLQEVAAMAIQRTKQKAKEHDERIDKQLDASIEPAKRLPTRKTLPQPEKLDPRARIQPSKQKHPPRAPGP